MKVNAITRYKTLLRLLTNKENKNINFHPDKKKPKKQKTHSKNSLFDSLHVYIIHQFKRNDGVVVSVLASNVGGLVFEPRLD